MLDFVAETAREAGPRGLPRRSSTSAHGRGQTIFHLHWHILGGSDAWGLPG